VSLSLIVIRVLADHALAGVAGPVGVPLTLAFGAGVLSTLNPCGFALLPAYVSYTIEQQVVASSDQEPSGWHHLLRGGLLGLPLTAGFLLVFLVAGFVLALGGRLLVHWFPWLAILVGMGLVLLGGWMLVTGRVPEVSGLGAMAGKMSQTPPGEERTAATLGQTAPHALRASWVFGVGYGLSSLGCTLPVFLLVVGTAITTGGVGGAGLVLASYAGGMALVLLAVAMAATTLGDLLRTTVFPLLRWVQPVAALFLIAAGGYIVFYQVRGGLW
jgi:cytochrome c-type biogenesis protein